MEKFRETVIDSAGNLVGEATITVYATGTTNKSTIYSDDGVTPESNSFTSGSDGVVKFYAADGRYDIKIVKSGFDTVTIVDHQLFDLGITGATGGISNTGNTTIEADSDDAGGGDILFQIYGSTRLQVHNNGDIQANTGNFIAGTAGKGIDFSNQASPAVGMNAELLDRYEEGTWTATITTDGTDFTTASRITTASYIRVGRIVTCFFSVSITSPTAGTGNLILTGLPFTSDAPGSADGGSGSYQSSMLIWGRIDNTSGFPMQGILSTGTTQLIFFSYGDTDTGTQTTATDLNGNTTPFIGGSITYEVA